jgi:hypothetical protein
MASAEKMLLHFNKLYFHSVMHVINPSEKGPYDSFGLMQVKTGLCHILSHFEVAPCKETPVRIVFEQKSYLLQMHGEIRLSFNRMQL